MNTFYCDGAVEGNGKIGFQKAYICVTDENKNILVDKAIGDYSNIQTEGFGIIAALEHIHKNKIKPATLRTDSEFWINIITRKWKLKKETLFDIANQIWVLQAGTGTTLEWVGRDDNLAGHHLEAVYESKFPDYAKFKKLKEWIKKRKEEDKKNLITRCSTCHQIAKPLWYVKLYTGDFRLWGKCPNHGNQFTSLIMGFDIPTKLSKKAMQMGLELE